MAATSLNLGQYLYRLIRQIDETKMSTLWVANEETHGPASPAGNQVIIKIARMSETRYSLTNQRAIENEEKWLIALEHPNIVRLRPIAEKHSSRQTVYRARSDLPGSPWFLVTDFLPGGDLYSLLGDCEKLPVSLALEIAERVGSALSYLHAKNCIHCDIKPRNILFRQRPSGYRLTADTQPIVIDFGIAKNPSDGPQLASGTPRWITPELADALKDGRKVEVQPSWDTYALGLVLYTMVSGRKPELDTPGRASWTTITAGDLAGDPSVKQMAPLVRGLNELITRTTAERPRDRISAADFTSELQRLLGMVQTPLPTTQRQPRRRSPWWVWAGAAAAFLLVAVVLWMARPTGDSGAPPPPQMTSAPAENSADGAPAVAAALTDTPTRTPTVTPTVTKPTSTRVHTPTHTHTPIPTATATARPSTNTPSTTPLPPTNTPSATPRTATSTPSATVQAGDGPTSTPLSPTSTPLPPTKTPTPTPRSTTPTPSSTPTTHGIAAPSIDMQVTLTEPADGASGQGLIRFSWKPSRPLRDNECFEVRFWQDSTDNWASGWGIWGANRDSYVVGRRFDDDYERTTGYRLSPDSTYFWGVLLVENCSAYQTNQYSPLRLVSPVRSFTYGTAEN